MSPKPLVIEKQRVLFVEGSDEVGVFEQLYQKLGRSDVQVVDVGGKQQLHAKLPAYLIAGGFNEVVSYAILQDADVSAEGTFQSVVDLLRKNHQEAPAKPESYTKEGSPRVGVFVLPGNGAQGMLEDLFWATLEQQPLAQCIERYIECLSQNLASAATLAELGRDRFCMPANLAKARAHAALAATSEPVRSLGLAARKGYWDFDHPALAALVKFLRDL